VGKADAVDALEVGGIETAGEQALPVCRLRLLEVVRLCADEPGQIGLGGDIFIEAVEDRLQIGFYDTPELSQGADGHVGDLGKAQAPFTVKIGRLIGHVSLPSGLLMSSFA